MNYQSAVSEKSLDMFLFLKNFLLSRCYLVVIFKQSMRKQSLAVCWGRCFCLMASTWYQSIGYFAVLWYIDKCQTPQARTIDSLPQCNLLFEYHPQAGCNCSSIIPPLLMLAMRIYYHVEKKSSTLRGEGCFNNNWPGN